MCKAIPPRMKVDTVVVPAMAGIIIMMNLYSLDAWDAWVAQIFDSDKMESVRLERYKCD